MDSCRYDGIPWYLRQLTIKARIPAEVHKQTRRQLRPANARTEAPSLPGGTSHSTLPAELRPNRSPQLAWGFITLRATLGEMLDTLKKGQLCALLKPDAHIDNTTHAQSSICDGRRHDMKRSTATACRTWHVGRTLPAGWRGRIRVGHPVARSVNCPQASWGLQLGAALLVAGTVRRRPCRDTRFGYIEAGLAAP